MTSFACSRDERVRTGVVWSTGVEAVVGSCKEHRGRNQEPRRSRRHRTWTATADEKPSSGQWSNQEHGRWRRRRAASTPAAWDPGGGSRSKRGRGEHGAEEGAAAESRVDPGGVGPGRLLQIEEGTGEHGAEEGAAAESRVDSGAVGPGRRLQIGEGMGRARGRTGRHGSTGNRTCARDLHGTRRHGSAPGPAPSIVPWLRPITCATPWLRPMAQDFADAVLRPCPRPVQMLRESSALIYARPKTAAAYRSLVPPQEHGGTPERGGGEPRRSWWVGT